MDIPKETHDDSIGASFGLKEDWALFAEQHQIFLQKWPMLLQTLQHVFVRTFAAASASDRVVFFLGQLIREDFMEILLLCGNGYGVAGLKILRGLYERAATAAYLAKNPAEVGRFLQYRDVHWGKLLNHTAKLFDLKEVLPEEKITQIKKSYETAKKNFEEPVCEKCNTSRTQISWSRLDVGSMAYKANPDLAKLYLQCYFMPTLQTHSTTSALFAQMAEDQSGGLMFDGNAQRKYVDEALRGAHCVILFVLEDQEAYFNLGLADEISQRCQDFGEIWGTKPFDLAKGGDVTPEL